MKKPAKPKPKRRPAAARSGIGTSDRPRTPRGGTAVGLTRIGRNKSDLSALLLLMMPVLMLAASLGTMHAMRRMVAPAAPAYLDAASDQRTSTRETRAMAPAAAVVAATGKQETPAVPVVMPEARTPDSKDAPALAPGDPPSAAVSETAIVPLAPGEASIAIPVNEFELPKTDTTVLAALPQPTAPTPQEHSQRQHESPALSGSGQDPAPWADAPSPAQLSAREFEQPGTDVTIAALAVPQAAHVETAPAASDAERTPIPGEEGVCKPAVRQVSMTFTMADLTNREAFGLKLAAAAEAQTEQLVIYTARYRRISYPDGDLPALYGACTDVVIRAYRALGVDLQELVHRARLGSDPNIDHRRTEILRRFFTRYGDSLPVSAYPEDYLPGDIVTYYRPFSRVSRAHIAIVSSVIAPSGRPMIVHNRGWGPQLEDALFSDRITGHYRFDGTAARITVAAEAASARRPRLPLQRAAFEPAATATGSSIAQPAEPAMPAKPGL